MSGEKQALPLEGILKSFYGDRVTDSKIADTNEKTAVLNKNNYPDHSLSLSDLVSGRSLKSFLKNEMGEKAVSKPANCRNDNKTTADKDNDLIFLDPFRILWLTR